MAVQYLTNTDVFMQPREVFRSLRMPGVITMTTKEEAFTKDFKGFGVAITGASCYNLSKMEKTARRKLIEDIYSPSGLNLSVGRLSIGSSDYSAELYSYDDVPFDTKLERFSVSRDEEYIIPMIKEILEVRPDLYIFASPWSPPGWMKTGGSLGGGYMRNEYVECYADYIVKFIKAYGEHGIKISAITPQNELETQQNGCMTACEWHPETEAMFIKILHRKLKENNLDVDIWMHDHNFSGADRVLWSLDNIEGLSESCQGVAFHYYGGYIEQTTPITKKYPKLELHFTEGGPRLYDNYDCDWCKWSIMISRAIKCGYKSFTGWNLLLDEMGGPNIGPFFCGGLVTKNSVTGELTYSGQYKAFRHIAGYINGDSKISPLFSDEINLDSMFCYPNTKKCVDGFLIENKDKEPVVILINPNTEKRQTQIYIKDSWWYFELMPDSVSTIVLD